MRVNIFWPQDLLSDHITSGSFFLVAFKTSTRNYVILTTLPILHTRQLQSLVINQDQSMELKLNLDYRGIPLYIAGCVNYQFGALPNFKFEDAIPQVGEGYNVFTYRVPNSFKMEFFSLAPLKLAIPWESDDSANVNLFEDPVVENDINCKLNNHLHNRPSIEQTDLDQVLQLINLTDVTRLHLIDCLAQKVSLSSTELAPWSMSMTRAHRMAIWISHLTANIFQLVYQSPFKLIPLAIISCTARLLTLISSLLKSSPLWKNASFLLHQLDNRTSLLLSLYAQFPKTRELSTINSQTKVTRHLSNGVPATLVTQYHPTEYIKFYNSLWLLINDFLIGFVIASSLRDNAEEIRRWLQEALLEKFLLERVISTITWLLNSPAGFKLNNDLCQFFGDLLLWVIKFWSPVLSFLFGSTARWDAVLKGVCFVTKFGGATFFIASLLDITKFITLHIYWFYFTAVRVYNFQLSVIKSLFRLLYGKKYNSLRNRVDSYNFGFDQLFLGTILFTTLVYLLPTVAAFYITFVTVRLALLTVELAGCVVLVFLNHFPIFVIMLRLTNRERLPAGIVIDTKGPSFYEIMPVSLSLGCVFQSFADSVIRMNLDKMKVSADSEGNKLTFKRLISLTIRRAFGQLQKPDWESITSKCREMWFDATPASLIAKILSGGIVENIDYKRVF